MRSLSAHLATAGDHGHLPFHPGCPLCCAERLSGPVPGDELVGQRPRALLAAAVLATSTAAPALPVIAPNVAVADESDDEGGGGAEDPDRKGFDDEGGFEDASEEALPADPGSPAPPAPTPPPSPAPSPQAPPTATPQPPQAPAPAPDSDPPREVPTPGPDGDPPPAAPPPQRDGEPDRGEARQKSPVPSERPRAPSAPSTETAATPATPPPPAATIETPSPEPVATGARHTNPATSPARVAGPRHLVRPGESLWSIAQDQLDGRASPAAVARLVNKLWELNADRIATGDPDLIMVGTVLQLP